jgi:hypothetical protein
MSLTPEPEAGLLGWDDIVAAIVAHSPTPMTTIENHKRWYHTCFPPGKGHTSECKLGCGHKHSDPIYLLPLDETGARLRVEVYLADQAKAGGFQVVDQNMVAGTFEVEVNPPMPADVVSALLAHASSLPGA